MPHYSQSGWCCGVEKAFGELRERSQMRQRCFRIPKPLVDTADGLIFTETPFIDQCTALIPCRRDHLVHHGDEVSQFAVIYGEFEKPVDVL